MKEEEVDVCSGPLNSTNGYMETRGDHEEHGGDSQCSSPPARTVELASLIKPNEVKFSSRSRLFVGNLGNSCTVDDVRGLFEQVGETSEVYVNREKGYGILRMDYRVNAEIAVNKLHQSIFKGRQLSVRFATMASAVEIHGLGQFITDKYLNDAFSQFGVIEKATVIVDDKGKSKGFGIVEFASKKTAQSTIQKVNDGIFCLEKLPKPVSVKAHEPLDDQTGVSEKDLISLHGYAQERDCRPRFVGIDSFEYKWAQRWRVLMHNEKQQRDALEAQLRAEREKLELEMTTAVHDSEAEVMRQELMRKTEELRRHEEMRRQEEQRRQESIRQRELELRRQEDMRAQDAWRRDEARRQDEFITRQKQELEARGVPATLPTRDSFRAKTLPQGPRPTSARLPLSQPGMPPLVPPLVVSSIASLRTVQPPILSSPLPVPHVTPPVVSQPLPLPRPVTIQSLAPPRLTPGGPHVVTVPVPVPLPLPVPSGLPAPPRPVPVPPMMRPPLPMPPRLPMDPRNVLEMLPGARRELAMPTVGPMFDAKRMRRF